MSNLPVMNEWVRTNEFRFQERTTFETKELNLEQRCEYKVPVTKKILQQKFELHPIGSVSMFMITKPEPIEIEWRDVPTVPDY